MKTVVSIIIATRNRAKALKKTISLPSLIKQSFKDFEVIVWDASDNNDPKIVCKEFKKNNPQFVLYYFKAQRVGSASQRNDIVRFAKGEVIFFIDDDSEVSPNGLQALIEDLKTIKLLE